MIIYYRYSLAVNIFETVQFCLVKMCLKCSDGIFIPKMYHKSTNLILINIRNNK